MEERYYKSLAVCGMRGYLKRNKSTLVSENKEIFEKDISCLTEKEENFLFETLSKTDFKLYRFKKSERILPRIQKVLGFLRGIYFESLLDVGSGRGAFLFPFMNEFENVSVKSIDVLDERVETLSCISEGGMSRLEVKKADICQMPFSEKSVDVVTLLEVLEHINNVEKAVECAVKTARHYVVVTVPSKEDNNPEHIHLLTKDRLTELFERCGVRKLSFGGVVGHLFMIAKVD